MSKSPDAFRTISEVADWLDTPAHVLRFWESKFTQVKPVKRAGGRRYYRPDDMALLGGIKVLLHEQGMTIKGAQKLLREKGVRHVMALGPPLASASGAAEPVRMPRPAPPDVEDAEIVPDAPFAEAEEPQPEGTLVRFPAGSAVAGRDEAGEPAAGSGFGRVPGEADDAAAGEAAEPGVAAELDGGWDDAPPAEPAATVAEDKDEVPAPEPLPDLVDLAEAAVAGPPAAESQPAVTPAPPTAAAPGLLGALMRADRGQLGRNRARLIGPAGRLAAVAERLARERG